MLQDNNKYLTSFNFIIIKFYILKICKIINLKCADCFCDIDECKISRSPFECPNCILDKCCCWEDLHFNANNNNSLN